MFQIKPISLCLLLLPVAAFAAEDPVFELDDVIVTATRQNQNKADALADVSVVTSEEIANSGAQTVADVLQTLPGVESSTSGGRGKVTSLFVRGTNTNQTVVLVDGVRMNTASSGGSSLQSLSLNQIDRIEVVRGSSSSIYGADAIGGVIQIFTKAPTKEPKQSISVGFGNKNSSEVVASASGMVGKLSYQGTISYENTEGFNATNPDNTYSYNPDKDGYRNTSFSGTLGYEYLTGQSIKFQTFQTKANSEYDSGPVGQDETRSDISNYVLEANNKINDIFSTTLRYSDMQDKSRNYNGGSDIESSHFDNSEKTFQAFLNAKLSWGGLILGAEQSRQKLDSSTQYTDTSRRNTAVFLGMDGKFGRNLLEASARNDDNQQFGNHSTGRIAYGFEVTPEITAKASYATGFKAPTFNDLYYPASLWGPAGNPDLSPEESKNTEVGLSFNNKVVQVNLVGFYNEISNLIIFGSSGSQNSTQNRDARITGASIDGLVNVGDFVFRANATYQDPRDLNKNTLLPRRARAFGNVGVDYAFNESLLFSANVHISAHSYEDNYSAGRIRHGGYSTTNLGVRYQINNQWQTSLSVDNLFDKKYTTAYGYNTSPLTMFWRVKYEH